MQHGASGHSPFDPVSYRLALNALFVDFDDVVGPLFDLGLADASFAVSSTALTVPVALEHPIEACARGGTATLTLSPDKQDALVNLMAALTGAGTHNTSIRISLPGAADVTLPLDFDGKGITNRMRAVDRSVWWATVPHVRAHPHPTYLCLTVMGHRRHYPTRHPIHTAACRVDPGLV